MKQLDDANLILIQVLPSEIFNEKLCLYLCVLRLYLYEEFHSQNLTPLCNMKIKQDQ